MKIGIIGSGVVAQTLGTKLVELGEDVVPERLPTAGSFLVFVVRGAQRRGPVTEC